MGFRESEHHKPFRVTRPLQTYHVGNQLVKIMKFLVRIDYALFIFSLLILSKLILAMTTVPFSGGWVGDEGYYVGKAHYIYENLAFPKIIAKSSTERTLGWSDFRPPGYPLFLSSLLKFGKTDADLKKSVRLAQFILDILTTSLVLIVVYRFTQAQEIRIAAALLLGLQPWTSAFITSTLPDTLTAFLTTSGLVSLAFFISNKTKSTKIIAIVIGSLLLSLAFTVRPEMIVFVPLLVLCALWAMLSILSWRSFLIFGLLGALPFFAIVAANMAYRWQVEQKIAIFGEAPNPFPGLGKWTKTWVGTQSVKESITFGPLMIATDDFASLPKKIFSSEEERLKLLKAVKEVKTRGYITVDDDDVFMAVAEERIKKDPLTYYILARLYGTVNFWINLNNANHYLNAFAFLPRVVSKILTAGFFMLKCLVFALFFAGLYFLSKKSRLDIVNQWCLGFIFLGIIFVISRTLFLGLYINYAEYRYAVPAWPFVLATALFGMSELWSAYQGRLPVDRGKIILRKS